MVRFVARLAVALGALTLPACTGADDAPKQPEGPLQAHARAAAARAGVPGDLVLAIAAVEGGLTLPRYRHPSPDDHVPVAGILELRHGRLDTLSLGAKLMGTSEDSLRADTDLGTEAGVFVLRELGPHTQSLKDWAPAIAELSGLSGRERDRYVADVYRVLHHGGTFPARDGERVAIAAHPELPPGLLQAPAPSHPLVDFPGAEWFPTDCTGKCTTNRPDGNASVDTIVIHDTEGGWNASVATLQYDAGKSVHYLIDADGSRTGQFIPETYTGWHAGNWCYNKHSIGIEHVGFVSDPNGYATELYEKSAEMVLDIATRWPSIKLDRDHVVGHYQIPNGKVIDECGPPCSNGLDACESDTSYGGASHHTDPGYRWQWCQYMELLGTSCHCNDAWSLWNCTNDKTQAWRCNQGQLEKQECVNGCDVMPLGTPDVCHTAADGGAGAAGAGGNEDASAGAGGASSPLPADAGSDAAVTPAASAGDDVDGGCGCRVPRGRSPGALTAAALALLLLRRKRRIQP